jgi:hypothetical protein
VSSTSSISVVPPLRVDLESPRVKKLRQHAILIHCRLGEKLWVVMALSICTRAHVAPEVDSTAIHCTYHLLSRLAYSMYIEHRHRLCVAHFQSVLSVIPRCILTKYFTIGKWWSILSYR